MPIDAALLRRMEVATRQTQSGDVDVLLGIPRDARWELVRYEGPRERDGASAIGELTIPIAALDDIIRSKEIADRPGDREALPELRRLRDELDHDSGGCSLLGPSAGASVGRLARFPRIWGRSPAAWREPLAPRRQGTGLTGRPAPT